MTCQQTIYLENKSGKEFRFDCEVCFTIERPDPASGCFFEGVDEIYAEKAEMVVEKIVDIADQVLAKHWEQAYRTKDGKYACEIRKDVSHHDFIMDRINEKLCEISKDIYKQLVEERDDAEADKILDARKYANSESLPIYWEW